MALCQFTRGSDTIAVDAPAEREWAAAIAGRAGVATITLPRDSPAASSTYIDPDTGSAVRISGQGGCGDWAGYVTGLAFADSAVTVTAVQPWAILGRRYVRRTLALANVTPGYVLTLVLRDALAGLPWFSADLPFGGGPATIDYALDWQDAWSVISDLMDTTQGELHIDAASGRMVWCGPLAYATLHDELLIGGTDLRGADEQVSGESRVSQVLATAGGARFEAASGATGGWAAQMTLAVDDERALASAATTTLLARRQPAITVTGSVPREWWHVRERDYLLVLLPHAGFSGRAHCCRVLRRGLADGDALMRLELQVVDPAVTAAAGIAARQSPPTRAGKDALTTRGTSFAAVWARMRRSVADIERDRTTTR